MIDNKDKINLLLEKLALVSKRQEDFSKEIENLRKEIDQLKSLESHQENTVKEITQEVLVLDSKIEVENDATIIHNTDIHQPNIKEKAETISSTIGKNIKGKTDLEKFIGENLINKIGIAITIIGVAIGAKYSIENELISPLTRIILGYILGLGLMGFGIKLKKKYENYSAVLVSGAIAIIYFITFAAYSFYDLIPQLVAFILMVIFTIFTVIAALSYNKQIIAHIGLIGAYAVPFLLSDGSGDETILFSYIAIINIAILFIAFKKQWKIVNYVSFALTWIIFISWYIGNYEKLVSALLFSFIYFIIFYTTFLYYKLLKNEKFVTKDEILIFINSILYYLLSYFALEGSQEGSQFLGLFTLFNAFLHFIASIIIYRQKLSDKKIQYFISGLVLIFLTIAIPVQLDGNWVTLMWAAEAALLFWIGRTKNISFYEKLSYPIMLIAFMSMIQDWQVTYDHFFFEAQKIKTPPIFNIYFLSSILFVAAFGCIYYLDKNKKYTSPIESPHKIFNILQTVIPVILIFSLYYTFISEINIYWGQLLKSSTITKALEDPKVVNTYQNPDLKSFNIIWLINYSFFFVSIFTLTQLKRIKNLELGLFFLSLNLITLFVFLVRGLLELSELRGNYADEILNQLYKRGSINWWIRYVSFLFVAFNLYVTYRLLKEVSILENFKKSFPFILHITILWIASSELIHWMDIFNSEQSYKLGLSILWGSYSLLLIIVGIWKNNKPIRIGAIALFAITLVKLFYYDISHLDTIAKTVLFVSLGVLLLIISFLYTKYKHLIEDEDEHS